MTPAEFLFRPLLAALICLFAASDLRAAEPTDFGEAVIAAPDRNAEDVKADKRRQPAKLIDFTGVKPGMTVMDMMAGGGYTTELMARAVGGSGRVYAQSSPEAPERARQALLQRLTRPAMANVELAETPIESPVPHAVHNLDLITFVLNYHDVTYMPVDRARMNKALFDGLKKGGVLVIVDHAALPGQGIGVAKTLHRIEESVVISEVEAAGFKKVAEANFLRNPNDHMDLPFFEMDQDTDRFVLKFVKP
jgi:predicted methyltransferase